MEKVLRDSVVGEYEFKDGFGATIKKVFLEITSYQYRITIPEWCGRSGGSFLIDGNGKGGLDAGDFNFADRLILAKDG